MSKIDVEKISEEHVQIVDNILKQYKRVQPKYNNIKYYKQHENLIFTINNKNESIYSPFKTPSNNKLVSELNINTQVFEKEINDYYEKQYEDTNTFKNLWTKIKSGLTFDELKYIYLVVNCLKEESILNITPVSDQIIIQEFTSNTNFTNSVTHYVNHKALNLNFSVTDKEDATYVILVSELKKDEPSTFNTINSDSGKIITHHLPVRNIRQK